MLRYPGFACCSPSSSCFARAPFKLQTRLRAPTKRKKKCIETFMIDKDKRKYRISLVCPQYTWTRQKLVSAPAKEAFSINQSTDTSSEAPPVLALSLTKEEKGNTDDMTLGEEIATIATVSFLGCLSKFIMQLLNNTSITNREALVNNLRNRKYNQGLITVSNHVSAVDDPGVIAAILPASTFLDAKVVRWTLCAKDRCFTNEFLGRMFHYGKVLPVERGGGIYQPCMDTVVRKLNQGQWIHMFPGGSRDIDGASVKQIRNGIARLITEPDITPIVIPIFHKGMSQILAKGEIVPLAFGKKLSISVGNPIIFDDLITRYKDKKLSQDELFNEITKRIQDKLNELKRNEEENEKI